MSTNDKIRKLLAVAVQDIKAKVYAKVNWDDPAEKHFGNVQLDADVNRILTALAPYLAPHPAQQGEDHEMIEWLIAGGYAPANWRPWTPNDGPASRFSNGMVMIGPASRETIRAAMARARSHSKQEGGA